MEDKYLYKAKRADNGEWVQGVPFEIEGKTVILIKDNENLLRVHYLYENVWTAEIYVIEVDSSTICQCTGLRDKNGKLIWENDITLRTSVTGTHKGKIIYSSDGSFCQKDFETTFENLLIHSESYFEVIGNIFDNKELVENKEN